MKIGLDEVNFSDGKMSKFLLFVKPSCCEQDIVGTTLVRCICVRFACTVFAGIRPDLSRP